MASIKEKALPSLPFFNKSSNQPNSNSNSNNSNSKFMIWFSKKYPKSSEFVKKYKKPILITLILFSIAIIIIIIVAAIGGFSRDTGEPGINMGGKGDGTYYDPGVGIGSCGWKNSDSEYVAALNAPQYGIFNDPADSPICGKCIKVTGPKGSVKVKLVDKCPVCKRGDVDMSSTAFKEIANLDDGRVPITWEGC